MLVILVRVGPIDTASAAMTGAAGCLPDLLSMPDFKFGIGVYGGNRKGEWYMGIRPYVASVHNEITDELTGPYRVRHITWFGELDHLLNPGVLSLREANETSSHFKELLERGMVVDGEPVVIENSVYNLPPQILAPNFVAHPFKEDDKRLARELQGIPGNIRHHIKNTIQSVDSVTNLLFRPGTAEKKQYVLKLFLETKQTDILLSKALVNYVREDGRLAEEDADLLLYILDHYARGDQSLGWIEQLNPIAYERAMEKVRAIINPEGNTGPVTVIRVR